MAAIPLNKFRTITHTLTTSAVGIYTCPPGVAALIIYGNVANVVNAIKIPASDAMNFIDGRLVLETGDILKISGDVNNTMKGIISILENAK